MPSMPCAASSSTAANMAAARCLMAAEPAPTKEQQSKASGVSTAHTKHAGPTACTLRHIARSAAAARIGVHAAPHRPQRRGGPQYTITALHKAPHAASVIAQQRHAARARRATAPHP